MTPAAETPGSEPQTFNINPIPATDGPGNPIKLAAGEPVPDPSTLTHNTVQSTVKDDKDLQEPSTFGVAPIPATAGAGNPVHLAPGEKVPDPSTLTSNTVQSTVQTDAASYEKSDALPPLAFTPQAERDARGGMFNLPPVSGVMIPESSLPMGVDAKTEQDTGVTIQSAAPTSTTAALAGAVPLEQHGVPPAPVLESQHDAGASPEASANPEAVVEKEQVEQELLEKVPEAPAAADNSYASNISSGAKTVAATTAAGITAGAGAVAAAIYATKDKAAKTMNQNGSTTVSDVTAKAAEITGMNGSAINDSTAAGDVPVRVVESQKEAHFAPEAASNPEAVHEKSQVEQELLSHIPKATDTGVAAPAVAIPSVVSESQKEAHASPEAAAFSEVVAEKKAVETELLKEIPKTNEAGEPAPALSAATTAFAPGAKTETATNVPEVVAESQKVAHASPEASSNAEAVTEKKAVETELLKEVKTTNATGESAPTAAAETSIPAAAPSTGLNAPASAPAQPLAFTPIENTKEVPVIKAEPTTTEQTKPTVTTGVETTTTEPSSSANLATPVKDDRRDSDISPKGTPGSQSLASATTEDKKKKRRSIFGKLKEKFSSKHDK